MAGYAFPLTLGAAQPAAGAMAPADYVDPYTAQMEELRKRMAQPGAPMYSDDEVAQRKGANARDYQMGLLGMLTGDENLGAVGGQVFKQALAARQPHVTEKGVADPLTGQFNYNPAYQRERDETQLDQLQRYSAQSRAQYDENRRKAGEAAELAHQRAQDQAAWHSVVAGTSAQARADAAQQRKDTGNYRLEDQMRGDFDKITKDNREEIAATGKIKSIIGGYAGKRMDPFAQQSVVVLLNKFLDPGSVVREGEFDRVVQAQGLEARAKLLIDRTLRGDILGPEAVQQISQLADMYEQAARTKMQYHANNYHGIATSRGLDPNAVISDPALRPRARPPAAGAGGKLPQGWTIQKE